MGKTTDLSDAPTVKPLLDAVGEDAPHVKEQMVEEIAKIYEGGHQSGAGALTDVVAPQGADPDHRRKAQEAAAVQHDLPDPRRRKILWGLGLLGSYGLGVTQTLHTNHLTRPEDVRESFLKVVLRDYSDKPRLMEWKAKLEAHGDTDKSNLLGHLISVGENIKQTADSLEDLGNLLESGKLSEFSRVFLRRAYSHHYRYLGFTQIARQQYRKIEGIQTSNRLMNTLLLNSKHMTTYSELIDDQGYSKALIADNRRLAQSFKECFGLEISILSTEAFRETRDVSLECVALKGLFFSNEVMAATTEPEAVEALQQLDEFSEQMFATIDFNQGDSSVIRQYGEVVWWYGRVAAVAFLNSWDNVVKNCLSSFYNPSTNNNTRLELSQHFHQMEKKELRSPVWISMALVSAMWQEVHFGGGDKKLDEHISSAKYHKFP